ncbi:MAG: extracellular solute-binding protein [Clostridia bacterium]|nr:extracellular solute-binding protein [Clostridia bacterium]
MRKNVLKFLSLLTILALMSTTLAIVMVGCGDKNNDNKNDPTNTNAIVDDLPRGEDGKFDATLLENVQLNLWSVIGLPDQEILLDLVKEFNKQYAGMIEIKVTSVGHYDYYNALDSTYANDYSNFPDVCLMHNEKNIEYALKGYFYPLDELIDKTGIGIDFANAYDNIEKTTIHDGKHYGIPIDAHGYLTQIRQDIIKKNGLGFDGNTRFVPQNYEEYQTLLEGLRALADSGELWVRNINLDQDHSWYQLKNGNPNLDAAAQATVDNFYPVFFHSQESDNLTALYVNGGSLLDANGKVAFQNNEGLKQYITDHVNRFNSKLYGDAGNKEAAFPTGQVVMFSEGPWQVANTYDIWWNNKQLSTAGKLGVTEEDAADPIYANPYTVARPYYMADDSAPAETASKWYGNGHVITVTKKVTSMQKVAAALIFAEWLTQGQDENGNYNLTEWCKAGHLPAWQNVYESDSYQAAAAKSITLTAMGDPADIIALESTRYATTLIAGLTTAVGDIQSQLLSVDGCTVELALEKLLATANSTQEALNLLNLGIK